MKVLSGEKSTMTIQVGTNDNEVIEFNLDKIDNDTLGVASDKLFDAKTEKKGVTAAGNAIDAKQINAAAADGYDNITVKEFKLDGKVVKDKFIVTKGSADYVVSKSDFELDAKGTKLGLKASATTKFTPDTGKDVKILNVKDDALATLDNAISKVDESRSKLGAIQNRFESTINNLNNTVNNLSASRSRILDADYATEVSNMSKNQILQQAGTAVLAQANQVPQTVLSLLR